MTSDSAANDKEAELERGTRLRGFRYGYHEFLAEVDLEGLKKVNDWAESTYATNDGLLDRKTKELLVIVTCVAMGDELNHVQFHMENAQKAGNTPEEILEALHLVETWVGAVKSLKGLEAWRATFRPDIPTIYRVVKSALSD